MTTSLDFYFDFSSPYGYLASEWIDVLAEKYGRAVVWRPVLLGILFKSTGSAPLAQIPLKGAYSLHDFARAARYLGVDYRQPTDFPIATHHAARAFYWLADRDTSLARKFARACYRAYFVEDRNISTPQVLHDLADALAVDPAQLSDAVNAPAYRERLKSETDLAMQRGVFGSPYFIVDGEPFWGVDRLPQLEKWLSEGGF